MHITEEQILTIVDKCFHSYASSFRNEARKEAITLINKHKEAITVTPCCTELKCSGCKKILNDGLCGSCCGDLASGMY